MKQKINDWNVPESYFAQNKSRLMHCAEWEVEDTYFEKNKANLLLTATWRIQRNYIWLAAAACLIGFACFIALRSNSELHSNPQQLALQPTIQQVAPILAPQPFQIQPKTIQPKKYTHTTPPVKPSIEFNSSVVPSENFEQALASISKEEIIDYLADETDDVWFDTNTN